MLVVPFGDGGLFFSYWADFVGEVGSVLWGTKDALPREGYNFDVNDSKPYLPSFH